MKQIKIKQTIVPFLLLFHGASMAQSAEKPIKPNILFCIADDASRTSFGVYGGTYVNTPAIDRLAREGVRFTNAYNINPKCAPARAMLVTGMFGWQLKEAANHMNYFPKEFACYPHLMMDAGYFAGYTGKGWGPGVHSFEIDPTGPLFNKVKNEPPYKMISNVDYAGNFAAFLDEKPEEAPFCFWLGTHEPHRPYEKDAWKKAGRKLSDAVVPPYWPDNETVRGDLLDYANEVEWYDAHVGRAVDELKKRGLLENTLIIVTSDHGMPFPYVKGQMFDDGFHVPMIAFWKGKISPGRVVDDYVSFPDVAPTIMAAAGLSPHPQMTGRSFLDLLLSKKSGKIDTRRDHVLLFKERHDMGRANEEGVDLGYPVRCIRNDEFLYVKNYKPERWPVGNPEYGYKNCDPSPTKEYLTSLLPNNPDYRYFEMSFGKRPDEMLFRISDDPHCVNNLANNPEYAKIKEKLCKQMETELREQGDPRMHGNGDVFDKYPFTKSFIYDKKNN
jgi:N-sulfoglucosamine sulfohydrolase